MKASLQGQPGQAGCQLAGQNGAQAPRSPPRLQCTSAPGLPDPWPRPGGRGPRRSIAAPPTPAGPGRGPLPARQPPPTPALPPLPAAAVDPRRADPAPDLARAPRAGRARTARPAATPPRPLHRPARHPGQTPGPAARAAAIPVRRHGPMRAALPPPAPPAPWTGPGALQPHPPAPPAAGHTRIRMQPRPGERRIAPAAVFPLKGGRKRGKSYGTRSPEMPHTCIPRLTRVFRAPLCLQGLLRPPPLSARLGLQLRAPPAERLRLPRSLTPGLRRPAQVRLAGRHGPAGGKDLALQVLGALGKLLQLPLRAGQDRLQSRTPRSPLEAPLIPDVPYSGTPSRACPAAPGPGGPDPPRWHASQAACGEPGP